MDNIQEKEIELKNTKLILVEGEDDKHFIEIALKKFSIDKGIDVVALNGISKLKLKLSTLKNIEATAFSKLTTIIIITDADNDYISAQTNIINILQNFKLPCSDKVFDYKYNEDQTLKVAYALFPSANENGCLEDLCIRMIQDDELLNETEKYLDNIEKNCNHTLTHKHKSRLYAYFAVKHKDIIGGNLRKALYKQELNLFKWDDSHHLIPFKTLLESM